MPSRGPLILPLRAGDDTLDMVTVAVLGVSSLSFWSGIAVGGVAGILVGILLGPAVPFLFGHREWEQASQQVEWTDDLLARVSDLSERWGSESPARSDRPESAPPGEPAERSAG